MRIIAIIITLFVAGCDEADQLRAQLEHERARTQAVRDESREIVAGLKREIARLKDEYANLENAMVTRAKNWQKIHEANDLIIETLTK